MKKRILGVVIGLTPLSVNAAIEPEIYFGGMFNFNAALPSQEFAYNQSTLPHENSSFSESNTLNKDSYYAQEAYLDILAIGKSDSNILYGGMATLMLDSNTAHEDRYTYANNAGTGGATLTQTDNSGSVLTRRAYIFAEKKTSGRIEVGDVEGPSKKMKFDAGYRFGGTGGISGNWWKYVNIPSFGMSYGGGVDSAAASDVQYVSGQGNRSFLIRPDLPLAHGYDVATGAAEYDDTRTINRISYYSPRVSGMQFGISYANDSGDRGGSYYSNSFTGDNNGDVEEVIDWGVNFMNQGSRYGIAFSLTGELGNSEIRQEGYEISEFNQQDLMAYAIGFYGYYGNFEFAASYGDWGNSLMFVREDLQDGDANFREDSATYTTLGIGYQFAAAKFSAAILSSEYREQEFTLQSVALDYRVTKNLTTYLEVNAYDFSVKTDDLGANCTAIDSDTYISPGQSCNNSGQVILIGTRIEFGGFDNDSQILLDTSKKDY